MLWVLLALACAAAVLLAVVLVRAALFKPGEGKNTPGEAACIEYKRAVEHLSQMVRVPTVSSRTRRRWTRAPSRTSAACWRRSTPG